MELSVGRLLRQATRTRKHSMNLVQINSLNETQIADLVRLYQNEWWTKGRTAAEVQIMLVHSDPVIAFAERGTGRLVAFARALTDRVYKALILDVIVDPAWRGSGLGRRLMEAVVNHPQLREVRHLELYCKPELLPLYRKWGFTEELGDLCFMRRTRT